MQKAIRPLFVCTLLLLFLFSRHSTANEFHVYGVVSDSSGNPIPGAAIGIKGTTFSDTTDQQGSYDIQSTNISAGGKTPAPALPAIRLHGSKLIFTLSGARHIELSWFSIAGRMLSRMQREYQQSGTYSLPLVAPASAFSTYILQVHLGTTVKHFRFFKAMSGSATGNFFSEVHSNTAASMVTTETGAQHKGTAVGMDTLTAFARGCRFELIPLTSNDEEVNITLVFCGTNSWASWPMPNPATTGLPNPAHYTDLGDGTVRDEVTGLVWQKNASTRTYTYEEALAYSESLGDGWRVPKRIELTSLFDFTRTSPAIDKSVFPTPSNFFVTSSPWILTVTDPSRPRYAWVMNFYEGIASNAGAMEAARYVRCVKGYGNKNLPATTLVNQYTEVAPGEMRDNYTGLIWQQGNSSSRVSLPDANTYSDTLSLNGHQWRLPSIKELATLVDETKVSRALNTTVFPETAVSEWYWSSSLWAGKAGSSSSGAWAINFDDGYTGYNNFTTARVKCVRVTM